MLAKIIRGGIDELGTYEGNTEKEILEDYATDNGYKSFEELLNDTSVYNKESDYEIIWEK